MALLLIVLGITITTLVFTLIEYFDRLDQKPQPQPNRPKPSGSVSNSPGFKDAANLLLTGLDRTVDPCEDFYAFSCNNYLKNTPIPEGRSRVGTYDQAQRIVDAKIAAVLKDPVGSEGSTTEKITKHVYDACVSNADKPEADKATELNSEFKTLFGGVPAFTKSWTPADRNKFLTVAAEWSRELDVEAVIGSAVTADYRDVHKNAIYLSGPLFNLPLDFYIKPTFQSKIRTHRNNVLDLFKLFAKSVKAEYDLKTLTAAVDDIVSFEIELAWNVIPDDLLKNFDIQYNKYDFNGLTKEYDQLVTYFEELIKDSGASKDDISFIVTQPRYLESLNTLLKVAKEETLFNYLTYQYLSNFEDFIGGDTQAQVNLIKSFIFRPKEVEDSNQAELDCVSSVKDDMPYGPGFVYVKSLGSEARSKIVADVKSQANLVIAEFLNNVDSLNWMTAESKAAVRSKADNLVKNFGYPAFFEDALSKSDYKVLDDYHKNYVSLLDETSYFKIFKALKQARQKTEGLGQLANPVQRNNFQESPAVVNAWYAPELNSITIPLAILNPPYYRLDFPQAFNFAGQGGTLGHELTHGFDSDGVQFGPGGSLAEDCNLKYCTWLDRNSTSGFLDMAQCVISQYSEQCCPLDTGNVHCANGDITQGENVADIGGQLAAYNAYRSWVAKHNNGAEEEVLPGLEEFTPNQVFWLTYGYSWCMNQKADNLVYQMLTNPHAPAKCRVNQVMQDVPAFAADFGCQPGQKLFPPAEKRCKVWTGK